MGMGPTGLRLLGILPVLHNVLWSTSQPPSMDQSTLVADYYRCLDDEEYEPLRSMLHPEFVQHRPDRSFESREAFVDFMATGRPKTETTHQVEAILESKTGLAAHGRLFDVDGTELFAYIDVFRFEDGQIRGVDTFS